MEVAGIPGDPGSKRPSGKWVIALLCNHVAPAPNEKVKLGSIKEEETS